MRAEKLYASGKTLFAWCDDKKIYSSEGGAFLARESAFTAAPAFCEAFDGSAAAPLFSDGEKTYVFLSGALYAANVPPFTAACYAYERLWIFGGGKLKFSAPLAYDDFSVRKDGGGEIEAPTGRAACSRSFLSKTEFCFSAKGAYRYWTCAASRRIFACGTRRSFRNIS